VNAIIKLQQDEYRTEPPAHLTEEIHEDVEAEPEVLTYSPEIEHAVF
jgi:hypothetical protein